jgi:hypothetical protein
MCKENREKKSKQAFHHKLGVMPFLAFDMHMNTPQSVQVAACKPCKVRYVNLATKICWWFWMWMDVEKKLIAEKLLYGVKYDV